MKERSQGEEKKETRVPRPGQEQASLIVVIGESPLVESCAALCAAKGFDVVVQWNPGHAPHPVPAGLKRSAVIPRAASLALELTLKDPAAKQANLERLDKALPRTCAIISNSITMTATRQAEWIRERHRLVGCGLLPGFTDAGRVEIAPTLHTPRETIDVVRRFFHALGRNIEIVQDRVGLVFPRMICQLVNEAAFAVQEDVAAPADIDLAARKGLGLPAGLFACGQQIGFRTVVQILDALASDLGEERYRACPLLRKLEGELAPT